MPRLYKVKFVDVGLEIEVDALIMEVAVSKAEKELQKLHGKHVDLGNKVSVQILGNINSESV